MPTMSWFHCAVEISVVSVEVPTVRLVGICLVGSRGSSDGGGAR